MLVTIEAPDDENEPFEVKSEYMASILEQIYPWRFTEELFDYDRMVEDLFSGRIYDWCEAMFGPPAASYPFDENGEPLPGNPFLIRSRAWAMWSGILYFKDKAHAVAFKIVWWPEKAATP